jgi:uncharacterized damage-inducible protein DinB
MTGTLRRMYRYQDWAMEQLWPSLETLEGADLDAPGCSGNGSIRGTLTPSDSRTEWMVPVVRWHAVGC